LRAQRALQDIDFRLRLIDEYVDYRQILTPVPAAPVFGTRPASSGSTLAEVVRRNNDEMAEMIAADPDRFAGFVAATLVTDPDPATEDAIRSVRDLGALGVQLEEDPSMCRCTRTPTTRCSPRWRSCARACGSIRSVPRKIHGSPAETPLSLVASFRLDGRHDDHHLAFDLRGHLRPSSGLEAHRPPRRWPDPALFRAGGDHAGSCQHGSERSLGQALESLKKQYFRMLYVDTAMFGGQHRCVVDFFGPQQVLFGTDVPFDTQGGSYFIPERWPI
jgi:aminocarboxymuconate-semialdehyde decarboxylase